MRIIVPEGMLKAAYDTYCHQPSEGVDKEDMREILEAALRWLAENPIVPSVEQGARMMERFPVNTTRNVCVEWQRRMFLAPGPQIPEAIKDLLCDPVNTARGLTFGDQADKINAAIIEAFSRGRKSMEAK